MGLDCSGFHGLSNRQEVTFIDGQIYTSHCSKGCVWNLHSPVREIVILCFGVRDTQAQSSLNTLVTGVWDLNVAEAGACSLAGGSS